MGVGPAYQALVAEAQVDAAVRGGLAPGLAGRLVAETMAGTAALLETRDYDTLAVRREVTSPGGTTARGLAALERGRRAAGVPGRVRRRGGRGAMIALAAITRNDIANYVQAVFLVYILLIFVYILLNMMFSLGLRPPYSRFVDAVMNFLTRRLRALPEDLPPLHPADRHVRPHSDDRDHRVARGRNTRRERDPRLMRGFLVRAD